MNKAVAVLVILITCISSSHAMEETNSLSQSFELVAGEDTLFPTQADILLQQQRQHVGITINQVSKKIPQENEAEKPDVDPKITVQEALLGKEEKQTRTVLSLLQQMYKNAYGTVTGSLLYQNKTVRYSTLVGTGTVAGAGVGILAYLYLKKY